jgi:N utilization substance protein A
LEITQTAPEYVEALMKKYIPEIEEWIVKIEKIARIPGQKTKVLVSTDDERVDPVWVCIGEWGTRIATIMDELEWERVDIAEWSDNRDQLIKNIFFPAKINKIEEDENMITIYADETQKPIIFGKWAVNLKLANKLLDKRVFVK